MLLPLFPLTVGIFRTTIEIVGSLFLLLFATTIL